jgi:hypothetical protein
MRRWFLATAAVLAIAAACPASAADLGMPMKSHRSSLRLPSTTGPGSISAARADGRTTPSRTSALQRVPVIVVHNQHA